MVPGGALVLLAVIRSAGNTGKLPLIELENYWQIVIGITLEYQISQ